MRIRIWIQIRECDLIASKFELLDRIQCVANEIVYQLKSFFSGFWRFCGYVDSRKNLQKSQKNLRKRAKIFISNNVQNKIWKKNPVLIIAKSSHSGTIRWGVSQKNNRLWITTFVNRSIIGLHVCESYTRMLHALLIGISPQCALLAPWNSQAIHE